jgi:branched-chain amino acid transport system ATP-binding protein
VISGEIHPTQGRVILNGRDITGLRPERISALGLARTFQRNNLFMNLSLYENVCLGALSRRRIRWNPLKSLGRCAELHQETEEILKRIGISSRRDIPVRHLSYGEQRQLEVAIALATHPSLLLIDEPSAGMSPGETVEMVHLLKTLPEEMTVAIIEHDMDVVFSLADRITVLHHGEVIADGSPQDVRDDPEVKRVYFGGGVVDA